MYKTHLFRNSITLLLLPLFLHAQKISEKQINSISISDINEIKGYNFNTNGNYCLKIHREDKYYFYTDKGTLGPFGFIGSEFGNNGHLEYNNCNDETTPWYYKNANGAILYGPVKGQRLNYFTSNDNAAVIVTRNDSLIYYINGKQVYKKVSTKESIKNLRYGADKWCAFSPNGNCFYTLTKGGTDYLYKNGELLTSSSDKEFSQLHINDAGEYTYAAGHDPGEENKEYSYMFHVTTKNVSLGPVRTVWENYQAESGAYYYYGDDNGPYYMVINNKLYKNISEPSMVSIPNEKNFAFTYTHNDSIKVVANDKTYGPDISKIDLLNIDTKGNFAFYGIKDYYLYKYINGIKDPNPITKYGVRPSPFYITPLGESVHFFATDDSTYVYHDNKLLLSGNNKDFKTQDFESIFINIEAKKIRKNTNPPFLYIENNNKYYILYKNTLSQIPVSLLEEANNIALSLITDEGFALILETGNDTYKVIANNTVIANFEGPEFIVKDNCTLTDKELVFFGIKNANAYQYTLQL